VIRLLAGDCRDVLATLPADSVQCVVTSPPYYGLRDYGTAQWDGGDAGCDHAFRPDAGATSQRVGRSYQQGHPHRECQCGATRVDRQIGLEATPDEYLATMVGVFREVKRVLRPDGTCWVNMGDSYATGGYRPHGDSKRGMGTVGNGYKPKDLLMMPARLALALQADGWWLRSDIIWHKPNPMPESCRDRPTSAHEHIFMLTKSARYYYDADAVREEPSSTSHGWLPAAVAPATDKYSAVGNGHDGKRNAPNPAGRNLRNVWTIATSPYPNAHFATYPAALAERCIKAGTSERGCCSQCGKPWVRQTSVSYTDAGNGNNNMKRKGGGDYEAAMSSRPYDVRKLKDVETTGWHAGCDHEAPVSSCVVLDPFAGAGTTLLCADRLQRDAIGIELNTAYTEMAMERCRDDAPLFVDVPAADPEDERMADLFAGDEYQRVSKAQTTPRHDGNRWNENNGRGFMPRGIPEAAE
jgi:DNA modification methylase